MQQVGITTFLWWICCYVVTVHILACCYVRQQYRALHRTSIAGPAVAAGPPILHTEPLDVLMRITVQEMKGLLRERHASVQGTKKDLALRFLRTEPRANNKQLAHFGRLLRKHQSLWISPNDVGSVVAATRWIEEAEEQYSSSAVART